MSQKIRHHQDLQDFYAQGFRPAKDWKLGLEFEVFVCDNNGLIVPWDGECGVEQLLIDLAKISGWSHYCENGRVLGLNAGDGRSVSLEPGAQLEFNTSPCRELAELQSELDQYLEYLEQAGDKFGFSFLALAANPLNRPEEIQRIPKRRYDILEPCLAEADELGLWMMKTTCGMQVNFDHRDADDAARKLRLSLRLSPFLNALFANSGIAAGEASGFASWRGHIWTRTDRHRCGIIPTCLEANSSLQDYTNWAVQAPMLFIERGPDLIDMRDTTFAEFLATGEAQMVDWDLHLSTLFPEARLRPQLELRSIDGGCPQLAMALCALVKGLFYSEAAMAQVENILQEYSPAEFSSMLHDGHRFGLSAQTPDGHSFLEICTQILACLDLREDEIPVLKPLKDRLSRQVSAGEEAQEQLRADWGGEVKHLIEAGLIFSATGCKK